MSVDQEEDQSRFFVMVPHDRIGALIGPDGSVKRRLEEEADVDIDIDSQSGEVCISSTSKTEDPFLVIKARDFVHAVGRGFNPQIAFILLQDDFYLEIINFKLIIGNNPNKIKRIKGRIIGRAGRTRTVIEETTGTKIAVYGHTVGIIGEYERLRIARDAILMLIDGAKHGSVYRFLEEKARFLKLETRDLWERASRDAKI